MTRFAKAAILLMFIGLLLLPALQMATGWLPTDPLNENRRLAPWPSASALHRPSRTLGQLSLWFQDHYGLRDILVRTKTQIDFSVFGVSDRVYIGSDGWLFYRSVIDVEHPQLARLSDADLDRIITRFTQLRDTLAARGIKLIVVTNELKSSFYGEHLPLQVRDDSARVRFAQFRARLAQMPGIQYLDTTPILRGVQAQRPIFHKTDFHWNDPAAFEVAGRLADMIAASQGAPPVWDHALKITVRDFSGGQADFLPLFRPPHEQALFIERTWPQTPVDITKNAGPFEWVERRQPSPGRTLLHPVVLFGDSFSDGMFRAGLSDYATAFARARLYQANLSAVLAGMPAGTRTFVLQFIDVTLLSFSRPAGGPLD